MKPPFNSRPYDGVSEWRCTECGHIHAGGRLAWICVGCPCEYVPDHPDVFGVIVTEEPDVG